MTRRICAPASRGRGRTSLIDRADCIQALGLVLPKQTVLEANRYLSVGDFLHLHAAMAGIAAETDCLSDDIHGVEFAMRVEGHVDDGDAEKLLVRRKRYPKGCHDAAT